MTIAKSKAIKLIDEKITQFEEIIKRSIIAVSKKNLLHLFPERNMKQNVSGQFMY